MRQRVIQRVLEKKIVAIVRGVYGEDCVKLAEALYAGGIELLEVTFDQSNPDLWVNTQDTIALLTQRLGDRMFFGAGTVTSVELVERAKEAGARFIVSPDVNKKVIRATVDADMVSMPGAFTPTEVLSAFSYKADFVKLFPAGDLGSAYLKAIRGPINHVRVLAVGGIDENNAGEFLQAGACGVGAGGKLVNKKWIAEGAWDKITQHARKLVEAVQ